MSLVRTNAAAAMLAVSPSTLRSWERRFGYPSPGRTAGGHRQYELSEIEGLRQALEETHNVSSAISIARERGCGPASPARLRASLRRFAEGEADRVMEESLAVRSVERTVEELLLPALEFVHDRGGREAEYEMACRWATGWLHAARRIVANANRPEGVFLFDSSTLLDAESLHVQALELALRRAGFRVLMLSIGLPQERVARAMRALEPSALVLCGTGATLDVVGRLVYCSRQLGSDAPVFEYRDAMPVSGSHSIRSLGARPSEAADRLKAFVEGVAFERALGAAPPPRAAEAREPSARAKAL